MASWTGSITLPDGQEVPDIRVALSFNQELGSSGGPTTAQCNENAIIFQSLPSTLPFLALSRIESIPLCFVAGPRWMVSSDNPHTASWFDQAILGEDDEDNNSVAHEEESLKNDLSTSTPWSQSLTRRQSSIGVLVSAKASPTTPQSLQVFSSLYSRRITEIVFYTETTPSSSGHEPQIKLFAQPLSSELVNVWDQVDGVGSSALAPEPLSSPEPRFFSSPWLVDRSQDSHQKSTPGSKSLVQSTEMSRKRPRTDSIQSKSGPTMPPSSSLTQPATSKRPRMPSDASKHLPSSPSPRTGPAHRGSLVSLHPLSRCTSVAPKSDGLGSTPKTTSTVPLLSALSSPSVDTRTHETGRSRSSLSRTKDPHKNSVLVGPSESQDQSPLDESVESKNKKFISRLVMSGMRLYGYQSYNQSKLDKLSADKPDSHSSGGKHLTPAAVEEYKNMYHQVYKGTIFAMRKSLSSVALYESDEVVDHLKEVVDKLLCVFCVDAVLPLGQQQQQQQEQQDQEQGQEEKREQCEETGISGSSEIAAALGAEGEEDEVGEENPVPP